MKFNLKLKGLYNWIMDVIRLKYAEFYVRGLKEVGEDYDLKLKGLYNWIDQKEKLIYIGMDGCWYQFAKVENPNVVWCEVLDSDLHLIEETK